MKGYANMGSPLSSNQIKKLHVAVPIMGKTLKDRVIGNHGAAVAHGSHEGGHGSKTGGQNRQPTGTMLIIGRKKKNSAAAA